MAKPSSSERCKMLTVIRPHSLTHSLPRLPRASRSTFSHEDADEGSDETKCPKASLHAPASFKIFTWCGTVEIIAPCGILSRRCSACVRNLPIALVRCRGLVALRDCDLVIDASCSPIVITSTRGICTARIAAVGVPFVRGLGEAAMTARCVHACCITNKFISHGRS
jgi:hypothetical protein